LKIVETYRGGSQNWLYLKKQVMFVGEPINIMATFERSVPLSLTVSFVRWHYFCTKCWFVPSVLPTLSVTGNCVECFVMSVALDKLCIEYF
jgi:hypothetical protein